MEAAVALRLVTVAPTDRELSMLLVELELLLLLLTLAIAATSSIRPTRLSTTDEVPVDFATPEAVEFEAGKEVAIVKSRVMDD